MQRCRPLKLHGLEVEDVAGPLQVVVDPALANYVHGYLPTTEDVAGKFHLLLLVKGYVPESTHRFLQEAGAGLQVPPN